MIGVWEALVHLTGRFLCNWPFCFLHLEHLVNVFRLSELSVLRLKHEEISEPVMKLREGLI